MYRVTSASTSLSRTERVRASTRALAERGVGEVDRGDVPALLGEPDRVPALAGSEVESTADGEAGDLRDEEPVRLGTPHQLGA